MARVLRHLIALGLVSTVVVGAYHLSASTPASVANLSNEAAGSAGLSDMLRQMTAIGTRYDLSALRALSRTDAFVEQQYVDPARFDYRKMYTSALNAVERSIPEVIFREEANGERLAVEIGTFSTELSVGPITSFAELERELRRVAAILEEHLDAKEVKLVDVEYTLINGVLSTLDPHSIFLPPEGSKKFEEDNRGEFGGLGISIHINNENNRLEVETTFPETPAFRAALQSGDQILRIDGESTLNMDLDEAVSKMRGKPGTSVTLTINREGYTTPKEVTLVRAVIKPSKVSGELLPGNIAYVKIDNFHEQVEAQLDEVLTDLTQKAGPNGLKGLVLDLRDNPGGYLHQAVAVVDRFLNDGMIVATVERNGRNREEKDAQGPGTEPPYPIAVLMSGHSASASEIVAGALKNSERAIIIGERSFGKGSVQNLYPFPDEARLKLTVARYLTPGDHSIQGHGISPDIELKEARVGPPRELEAKGQEKEMSGPQISLLYREHLQREADLEGSLASTEAAEAQSPYAVRYLITDKDAEALRALRPGQGMTKDFEVELARQVLAATRGGGRRPDALKGAEGVVKAAQATQNTRIEAAFRDQSINWSACANPTAAKVAMRLQAGQDNQLSPATWVPVTVTVTNQDTRPLCQTIATAKSGNLLVDGLEFYFGKINPGESKSYTAKIRVPESYPTQSAAVDLTLQDLAGATLATSSAPLASAGVELPHYAWSWAFSDKAGGDGDGVLEVGETIDVAFHLTNDGKGQGGKAEAFLKRNRELGRSIEIIEGTFNAEGLAPGASADGSFRFKVTAPLPSEVKFELRLRDESRYDYGAYWMGGFYGAATLQEDISFPANAPAPRGARAAPRVELTRAPSTLASTSNVTLSGVATDDTAIRDIVIYQGGEKIGFAGGGDAQQPLRSVPFTATATLKEGNNLFVVLVRDADGLTTTRSLDIFLPPSPSAAKPK